MTTPVLGAAGIAFDAEGRVLLVRDDDRGWSVPGGRVEWGQLITYS